MTPMIIPPSLGRERGGRAAAVLAAVLLGSGCLATTEVALPDLVGDWRAREALLADPANLNERIDVTALGWEVTLEVAADGAYELAILVPGQDPDVRSGTLTIENGKDLVLLRNGDEIGRGEVFAQDERVAFLFDEFAGLEADIYGTGTPIPVTLMLLVERP